MADPGRSVRLATPDDADAVASVVGRAFAHDAAWSFMIPGDDPRGRESFARALLLPRVARGTAWVTDDCSAVAMWDRCPPTPSTSADHDVAIATFRNTVGEEIWARVESYDSAVKSAAPPRPYWYLGVLATDPNQHGRGLATSVLTPGLAAADAEGWDCWLETSTPANKGFYAGRGFTEVVPIDDADIPPTWWLCRPSAASGEGTRRRPEAT